MRAALPARCGGIQKEAVRQKRQITAQAQRAGATSGKPQSLQAILLNKRKLLLGKFLLRMTVMTTEMVNSVSLSL